MIVEDLLTPETAEEVAKYIADNFGESNEKRLLDCDFHLSKGSFHSENVNTWFKIDYEGKGTLRDIINHISEGNMELTEERIALFDKWKSMISVLLETKFKKTITNKLRKFLLGDLPKEVMPLENMRVDFLEISEKPKHDYLLTINKLLDKNTFEEGPERLSEIIFRISDETGEDPVDVANRLKKEGDKRFQCVQNVEKRKHFYEIELDLWIDYSLASKEEIEKFEKLKNN